MTQEDKKLLLKDLCARLPYGVKVDREWIAPMSSSPEHSIMKFDTFDIEVIQTSIELGESGNYRDSKMQGLTTCDDGKNHFVRGYMCKPYLRPMSSMTEEEEDELNSARMGNYGEDVDWLNAHHFNYRFPPHLFIEVTPENNPYK